MPHARTQDGSVAADISRGAVRVLREYTGRGPTKARTVMTEDTVAIVLGDTLTKGEQSLVAVGEHEQVLHSRRSYQQVMGDDLVQLVEKMSGRTVDAFLSANHIEPDYEVEFFLLKPLPGAENDPETSGAAEPPLDEAVQLRRR
jgi:uncharacterized protein YbcI